MPPVDRRSWHNADARGKDGWPSELAILVQQLITDKAGITLGAAVTRAGNPYLLSDLQAWLTYFKLPDRTAFSAFRLQV
jgi:hypothetical protein